MKKLFLLLASLFWVTIASAQYDATNLAGLNPAKPLNSDPFSQGAAAIREIKEALINTLGVSIDLNTGQIIGMGALASNAYYAASSGYATNAGYAALAGALVGTGGTNVYSLYKPADSWMISSTVLTNDPDLRFTVHTGEVWAVHAMLRWWCDNGTPDLQVAASDGTVNMQVLPTADSQPTVFVGVLTNATTPYVITLGQTPNPGVVYIDGTVANNTTTDIVFAVQWAQKSSNAHTTTVQQGSCMVANLVGGFAGSGGGGGGTSSNSFYAINAGYATNSGNAALSALATNALGLGGLSATGWTNYVLSTAGLNTNLANFATEANHATNADHAVIATNALQIGGTPAANVLTNGGSYAAVNVGTATYATTAGAVGGATNALYAINAGYATNAGTATFAVTANTANSATSAGLANFASNAGYSTNSGSATFAVSANYATNAGTAALSALATNALNANTATNALKLGNVLASAYTTNGGTYAGLSVGYATSAGSIGQVTNALYANSAGYATNSGSATFAVGANYATNAATAAKAVLATNALNAAYATNSGSATFSDHTRYATSALYAASSSVATTAIAAVNASYSVYATNAGNSTLFGGVSSNGWATGTYSGMNVGTATYAASAHVADWATVAGSTTATNILFGHLAATQQVTTSTSLMLETDLQVTVPKTDQWYRVEISVPFQGSGSGFSMVISNAPGTIVPANNLIGKVEYFQVSNIVGDTGTPVDQFIYYTSVYRYLPTLSLSGSPYGYWTFTGTFKSDAVGITDGFGVYFANKSVGANPSWILNGAYIILSPIQIIP